MGRGYLQSEKRQSNKMAIQVTDPVSKGARSKAGSVIV